MLMPYQSPTGSTGHFASSMACARSLAASCINPQRAPLAILPSGNTPDDFHFVSSINPQRAPLAILPDRRKCISMSISDVSIPNGLHWPFCRSQNREQEVAQIRYQSPTGSTGHFAMSNARFCMTRYASINPQRAPLAILPRLNRSIIIMAHSYQSPTGSTGHFACGPLHLRCDRSVINPQRAPLAILPAVLVI